VCGCDAVFAELRRSRSEDSPCPVYLDVQRAAGRRRPLCRAADTIRQRALLHAAVRRLRSASFTLTPISFSISTLTANILSAAALNRTEPNILLVVLLPFYGHCTRQPVLAGTPRYKLEDFVETAARMPLLMATSIFGLGRRRQSSHQQCNRQPNISNEVFVYVERLFCITCKLEYSSSALFLNLIRLHESERRGKGSATSLTLEVG